jgi:hypothetical protein
VFELVRAKKREHARICVEIDFVLFCLLERHFAAAIFKHLEQDSQVLLFGEIVFIKSIRRMLR